MTLLDLLDELKALIGAYGAEPDMAHVAREARAYLTKLAQAGEILGFELEINGVDCSHGLPAQLLETLKSPLDLTVRVNERRHTPILEVKLQVPELGSADKGWLDLVTGPNGSTTQSEARRNLEPSLDDEHD